MILKSRNKSRTNTIYDRLKKKNEKRRKLKDLKIKTLNNFKLNWIRILRILLLITQYLTEYEKNKK